MRLLLLLLLAATIREVQAVELLSLRELSLGYRNHGVISETQKDLLLYPEPIKEMLQLEVNVDLFNNHVYINSKIEARTTNSQYRGVGLEERLGVYLWKVAELGFVHHSIHVLDRPSATLPGFVTQDALELKLYLYRR